MRTLAVRALRVFALCASAAHECVPVLCARCTCAVCRRHVRARAHACCACPCGVCASCAPSCWACGALVQRLTRSCDIRSSTSSTSRGCTVLCALRCCVCVPHASVACTCCACACYACLRYVRLRFQCSRCVHLLCLPLQCMPALCASCGVWCACAALIYIVWSSPTLHSRRPWRLDMIFTLSPFSVTYACSCHALFLPPPKSEG